MTDHRAQFIGPSPLDHPLLQGGSGFQRLSAIAKLTSELSESERAELRAIAAVPPKPRYTDPEVLIQLVNKGLINVVVSLSEEGREVWEKLK